MAKAKSVYITTEQFISSRKKLGLTQAQLAEEVGITTRSVQIYERKGAFIPKKIGLALAYLLSK
jgi:transcriptional regulator with XRE-family HTH domain